MPVNVLPGALAAWVLLPLGEAGACSDTNPGPCADGVSSAVVAPGALRAHGQARAVASRHDVLTDDEKRPSGTPAQRGAAAGEALLPEGPGLWFARDHARFEATDALTPYSADSRVLSLGLD